MRYVPEYSRFKTAARTISALLATTSLSSCREALAYAMGYANFHELTALAGKEPLSPLDEALPVRARFERTGNMARRLTESLGNHVRDLAEHDAVAILMKARPFGGPAYTDDDCEAVINFGLDGLSDIGSVGREGYNDDTYLLNVLKDGKTILPEALQPLAAFSFSIDENGILHVLDARYDRKERKYAIIPRDLSFEPGTWDVAYAASGIDNSAVCVQHENPRAPRYGVTTAAVVARGLSEDRAFHDMTVWCDDIKRHGDAISFGRSIDFGDRDERFINIAFAANSWESCRFKKSDGTDYEIEATKL